MTVPPCARHRLAGLTDACPCPPPQLLADFKATIEAMTARMREPRQPLGPLLVPDWLPDLVAAEGHDLDEIARAYGFDGWTLFDA